MPAEFETPAVDSVLGKMNRVVYSHAHVSTVAPDYIEPSFLKTVTIWQTLRPARLLKLRLDYAEFSYLMACALND